MVDLADPNVIFHTQILKDKLYFVMLNKKPGKVKGAHFFTCIPESLYTPFFEDFGPPSIARIYRFSVLLDKKLMTLADKKIYFYSYHDPKECMNAAFLLGAYLILRRNMSPKSVYAIFKVLEDSNLVIGYRDAAPGEPTYELTLLDCFRALYRAKRLKFIHLDTFNLKEYEYYESVEHGDFNWIIPGKLLALCSPVDETKKENIEDDGQEHITHPPEYYIPYFQQHNITDVIRLNCNEYDKTKFLRAGIRHHDMYFVDGTKPPLRIVNKYLEIVEGTTGAVAVHCKAGLGRTGTLNGCYLIKNFGFTSREAIAFMRIQRPGSVIGPQQHFLDDYEIFIRKKQAAENTVPVSEDEIELDSEEDSLADLSCDADNDSSCAEDSTSTVTNEEIPPPPPTKPQQSQVVPLQPRKYLKNTNTNQRPMRRNSITTCGSITPADINCGSPSGRVPTKHSPRIAARQSLAGTGVRKTTSVHLTPVATGTRKAK